MRLTVLGSSSKGNGYVIQDEHEALVIEAGVHLGKLMEAVSFNVKKIAGCIVTHEHGDHAKYANTYIMNGIKVYMSEGTMTKCKFSSYVKPGILVAEKNHKIGNFTVMPFLVNHDAEEPFGFLVHHKKIGNLVFLTDTYYSDYTFNNLNHIIVEANYCTELAKERFLSKSIHPKVYFRLFKSHMSIQTTLELLESNDLTQVKNVVLIHLSANNSNADDFKKQVIEATGIPTTIADIGVEIHLTL